MAMARIVAALTFITGCGEAASQQADPTSSTTPTVDVDAPISTQQPAKTAAPPEDAPGEVVLDFALRPPEATTDRWVLTVQASTTSSARRSDSVERNLERWNGTSWDAIAIVPLDQADGIREACDVDQNCISDASDPRLEPGQTGISRTAYVPDLTDGVYRMTEPKTIEYSVSSNRVTITNGKPTDG
jgi:hypothetical protein